MARRTLPKAQTDCHGHLVPCRRPASVAGRLSPIIAFFLPCLPLPRRRWTLPVLPGAGGGKNAGLMPVSHYWSKISQI